jgi:hypothetical protein
MTLIASQLWSIHATLVGPGGALTLPMGARLRREFAGSAEDHPTKAASEPKKAGSEVATARLSPGHPAR